MTLEEFARAKGRRSTNTSVVYSVAVRDWGKTLGYNSPDGALQEIKSGRLDAISSLDRFAQSLYDRKLAPKSVSLYVGAVQSFLRYHSIKLDRDELRARLVLKDAYVVSQDRGFSDEEIRSMLLRANLKAKTIVLVGVTTGARIGEIGCLKVGHLDLNRNPPTITIVAPTSKEKMNGDRTLFTTQECANVLKEFLGERLKNPNEWVFPHPKMKGEPEATEAHISQMRRLIQKCGFKMKLDDRSKRYALHTHCLRKTFYSKLISCGVVPNLAEAWMGHKVGLDSNYLRMPEQNLISEWRKVEPSLVFLTPTDPKTIANSVDRLKQTEAENIRLRQEIEKMDVEGLRKRIGELESIVAERTYVVSKIPPDRAAIVGEYLRSLSPEELNRILTEEHLETRRRKKETK